MEIINPIAAITAVSLIVLFLTKIHPILVILAAGTIGVIAFRRSILKLKEVL